MKKFIFPFVLSVALFLTSCSNDSDDNIASPPLPNSDVTYAGTIKAIIDNNCLNCHTSPPVNGAPIALTTYTNVKDAVQNRGLVGRIENGSMPPNGSLTTTQIQAIKDWQAGGFMQ